MITAIPHLPPTNRHPADAEYVVTRPHLRVDGLDLSYGDRIPADSPIRRNLRRLEVLVRLRQIEPKLHVSQPTATVAEALSAKSEPVDGIDAMTVSQLVAECRKRKLAPYGNKSALRQRLRSAMG